MEESYALTVCTLGTCNSSLTEQTSANQICGVVDNNTHLLWTILMLLDVSGSGNQYYFCHGDLILSRYEARGRYRCWSCCSVPPLARLKHREGQAISVTK